MSTHMKTVGFKKSVYFDDPYDGYFGFDADGFFDQVCKAYRTAAQKIVEFFNEMPPTFQTMTLQVTVSLIPDLFGNIMFKLTDDNDDMKRFDQQLLLLLKRGNISFEIESEPQTSCIQLILTIAA